MSPRNVIDGLTRRTALKVISLGAISGTPLSMAEVTSAQNQTQLLTSFEEENVGDQEPADPWYLFNDTGIHEVSDGRASHGSQSFRTADATPGNYPDPSAIAIDLDLTDVEDILFDVYAANNNPNQGNINVSLDNAGTFSDGNINIWGFPQEMDDRGESRYGGEGQWWRDNSDQRGVISDTTGVHPLIFWIDGDQDVYWDNIRLVTSVERFDPVINGFGFTNSDITGNSNHNHNSISLQEVRDVVFGAWKDIIEENSLITGTVTSPFLSTLAVIAYIEINDQVLGGGHCLGMVMTARDYFRNPEDMPVDEDVASDITNAGNDDVGHDIDQSHNLQAMDFDIFWSSQALGKGQVDIGQEVEDLAGEIGPQNPVPVGVADPPNSSVLHAPLAYDISDDGDKAKILLYDPNEPASFYEDNNKNITIGKQNGTVNVTDSFFFSSRYPDLDSIVTLPTRPDIDVLQTLLSGLVFFELNSPGELRVIGPSGDEIKPLKHPQSLDRTERDISYQFNPEQGEYSIEVIGTDSGKYTLELRSAKNGEIANQFELTSNIQKNETDKLIIELDETGIISRKVTIDIKPCSDPNAINPDSRGNIPVAIKHTDTFDPNDPDSGINVDSLRFGARDEVKDGGGASPAHGGHIEDVVPCEGDGLDDLVVHFPAEDTGFDGDEDRGRLEGETKAGMPLYGFDSVKIVGNSNRGSN